MYVGYEKLTICKEFIEYIHESIRNRYNEFSGFDSLWLHHCFWLKPINWKSTMNLAPFPFNLFSTETLTHLTVLLFNCALDQFCTIIIITTSWRVAWGRCEVEWGHCGCSLGAISAKLPYSAYHENSRYIYYVFREYLSWLRWYR